MTFRSIRCVRLRTAGLGLMLAVCGLVVGCGESGPPNATVKGRLVTKGGVPIDEGKLMLVPDPPNPDRVSPGATLGPEGRFEAYSNKGGAGIPTGKYKVVVVFAAGRNGKPSDYAKAFEKYTKVDTTPLLLDVPAGGITDKLLELEEPADDPKSADGAKPADEKVPAEKAPEGEAAKESK